MKLGSDTGSFINHIHSRATKGQPEPVVDMGLTFLGWTDRSPGTIFSVKYEGGAAIAFMAREDKAVRVDSNGMSEVQAYEYSPNIASRARWFRRDKNGLWRESELQDSGRWKFLSKTQEVRLGSREKYHDFSF